MEEGRGGLGLDVRCACPEERNRLLQELSAFEKRIVRAEKVLTRRIEAEERIEQGRMWEEEGKEEEAAAAREEEEEIERRWGWETGHEG